MSAAAAGGGIVPVGRGGGVVEVEVQLEVKRGLGIGKRILCWCLVGLCYAGILQVFLDGSKLQKEKKAALRFISDASAQFDGARFSIQPLISLISQQSLKSVWQSPLTLYLALFLAEILTPFPLLKARLLTIAYGILVSYAALNGTDTPAKLKECNNFGNFDLNVDSMKSYPMLGMRSIEWVALAMGIYLFYAVVRAGERLILDDSRQRGKWLMYLLFWGEPLLLPVLFLPDVHILNFAFSWSRNFATHFPKAAQGLDERQMAAKLVAYASAQDEALNALSLRLPGSSYTQAAGLTTTRAWVTANPRCFARINDGLFTFKLVILALFVYGVVNKPLWSACKRLTSLLF